MSENNNNSQGNQVNTEANSGNVTDNKPTSYGTELVQKGLKPESYGTKLVQNTFKPESYGTRNLQGAIINESDSEKI